MTDSWLGRMRRVVVGNIETAVDAAERHSSGPLMREALREMDRALERARAARGAVDEENHAREERRAAIAVEAQRLEGDARYALERDRRDLAVAIMARRVDLDAELTRIADQDRAAGSSARVLDDELDDLIARRDAMRARLHVADIGAKAVAAPHRESAAARAEEVFERALAIHDAGSATDMSAAAVAEIDALKRRDEIDARLAALAKPAKPARRPSRRTGP